MNRFLPYLIIFCFSFLFLSNFLLSAHWTTSHEADRYLNLMEAFKRVFSHGFLYPRWLTDMYGGYGYPTFVFYQPMFFFCSLPFNLVLSNPFLAVKVTVLLLFFAGAVGAYKIARFYLGHWRLAVGAAILYLLTPYLYLDLFVRGALGELCVVVLIPWVLYCLLRLKWAVLEDPKQLIKRMILLGLSIAAILYAHLPVSMIFIPCLAALMFVISFVILNKGQGLIFLVNSLMALIIGFALSAPYWLLCLSLHHWVHWQLVDAGPYASINHVVYFKQLFSTYWGFGGSGAGSDDGMSFQLGAMHFLLALAGFILGFKYVFIRYVFILYMALIVLMSYGWFFLVKLVPFIGKIQFPWRILSITASLQMICAVGVFIYLQRFKWQIQVVFMGFIFLLIGLIHVKQFWGKYEQAPYRYDPQAFTKYQRTHIDAGGGLNEFLPKTAPFHLIPPRTNFSIIYALESSKLTALPGSSDYVIHYQVFVKNQDFILINQLYFPGWKVLLDGKLIDPAVLKAGVDPLGRIVFKVDSPGVHTIKAFYGGPPHKELVYMAVLIIVLAALLIAVKANQLLLKKELISELKK